MNIDKNILEVPIEDIIPNRFQPRLAFNEEGINELSESIKEHGIIQPLVVRKLGDKYEIIAGERRYKASTMAGLTKVPVIISDIDDNKSAEVALVENIQRRNLTAIEEAKSYKNLLDRGYLTQEQLANKMGVSQSAIANKLRLLNLDEEVQEALLNEKISERHARSLLTLEDKEDQKKWLKRIIEERLTVRQLDLKLKKQQEDGEEDEIPLVNINPNLDEIVSHAEDIHVERTPHDVASMLIPEGGISLPEQKEAIETVKSTNKFFNFLEDEQANMSVVEPDEIFNSFIEEPKNEPQEIKEEIKPTSVSLDEILNPNPATQSIEPNKEKEETILEPLEILDDLDIPIFESIKEETPEKLDSLDNTFLKENIEENNFSEIPLIEDLQEKEPIFNEISTIENKDPIETSPEDLKISIEDQKDNNPLPIVEEVVPTFIKNDRVEEQEVTSNNQLIEEKIFQNDENIDEDNEEVKPFKSIFFHNEEEDETAPIVENPILANQIQEIEPVIEEPIVDPLDRIVTLEPGYEQKQQELAGTDLKTAINIVRTTVKDLEDRGFIVESEEADLEEIYHITIKINKENK